MMWTRVLRPRRLALVALVAMSATACKVSVMRDGRVGDERVPGTKAARQAAQPAVDEQDEAKVVAIPIGASLPLSHATVLVRASRERVRAVLLDFEHYAEFMPNYRACQTLGVDARGFQGVRMDIEVLGGIVHFLVKFEVSPPKVNGAMETYEMAMVEGNVKSFRARWQLEEKGPDRTFLTVDSLLEPGIPIPVALMASGSLAGAEDAIVAIKRRAEHQGR